MKYELHPRKPEEFAESDYARQSFVAQHPVAIKPPGAGPKTAWDDSTVDRNGGVEVDTAEKLSMEYRKLLPPQDTIF